MNTVTRYILINSLISILTLSVFAFYSLHRYYDVEAKEESENLEKCIQTFRELLRYKGEGFRIVDNRLLAGSYLLNNNFEVPDKVQEIFGGVATIFMGNLRVSTNVLDGDGRRAVGTKLVGPAYDAIFKQGKPYRGEALVLGVPYLAAYDPIKDKNGEIIGVLFVGLKTSVFLAGLNGLKINLIVTMLGMVAAFTLFMVLLGRETQKFERKNQDQFRLLQTLIDTIPSPVYYKDTGGCYLGCNNAFEASVGKSREELIGKTVSEIWPTELAAQFQQQDQELFDHPGLQVYEQAVRNADGTRHEVVFNKASFHNEDGSLGGLVGIMLDITERKAAEEATRNAYQQLFDIVEFLPDATFVVDRDRRVIAWNRALEKMTGVKKADVIGKGDYEYALPFYGERRPILIDLIDEDVEVVRNTYAFIKVEERTLCAETYIPSFRDNGACYLWGTATPLFDSQGNQVGGIESIRDITEYKRAVEEKSRLESQLVQAHMMETLMVRLGHDLKTPLTPLFILLPLLKKRMTEPDLISKVDICIKSAASINNLAEKTRMLVSLSSGVNLQEQERHSLASIVDEVIAESSGLISKKRIDCHNTIEPTVVVRVVPAQVHELFMNLVSNAVHFSGENGAIVVSAEQHAETVTITVQDQGVGITPDHLDHVFDEYFKADESRHDIDTPGLGLSICKRIVQNHHGRIWAESPGLGRGTAIKFTMHEKLQTADIRNRS